MGRDKLPEGEKKMRIVLFVKGKTIEANGGVEECVKKVQQFLTDNENDLPRRKRSGRKD